MIIILTWYLCGALADAALILLANSYDLTSSDMVPATSQQNDGHPFLELGEWWLFHVVVSMLWPLSIPIGFTFIMSVVKARDGGSR